MVRWTCKNFLSFSPTMSTPNPTTPIADDDEIAIQQLEAALAAAKERKERIRLAREEAARITREEAKRLAKEEAERLEREEAERKAEEERLAKEAEQREVERSEAEWKAREEEEAKARAEEEDERTRRRLSAEKIADDTLAAMSRTEEEAQEEKDAAAGKVAGSSRSVPRGGKNKVSSFFRRLPLSYRTNLFPEIFEDGGGIRRRGRDRRGPGEIGKEETGGNTGK